jgi:putative transposase
VIATGHPEVSVERRCKLLGMPRSSYYRGPASGLRSGDLELMLKIDKLYMEHPWMGSRSLANHITTPENPLGRDRARRLMLIMGIESLAPKPGTSRRQPKHPVYPYLLRELGNQKGSVLATVQHIGYEILCRGAQGGAVQIRRTRDFQH